MQTDDVARRGPRSWLARRGRVVLTALLVATVGLSAALITRSGWHADRLEGSSRARLAEARQVLAGDQQVVVSVLGDSTGNDTGEWVSIWSQHLARTRTVTVDRWSPETRAYTLSPWSFGTSGPGLTVWNASQPGARADFPVGQLERVQPERPDLVIYSFGHNNSAQNIATEMESLHRAVQQRWESVPEVVIVQNQGSGDRGNRQAVTLVRLRAWAADAGLPTIDVEGAFAGRAGLGRDDVHPNEQGSAVWAQAVSDALA